MKIYTKKGDKGQTSLIGGTRVDKHHIRIEAYGTVDELNSYIGLIRDQEIDEHTKKLLIRVQDRLFTIGSLLAADPEKSKMKLPQINAPDIEDLEKEIDLINEVIPEMRSFVLPGGHPIVSHCHIARCICRRAERKTTYLASTSPMQEEILTYLNRLSDYLFTLGRKLSFELKAEEIPWKPEL